MEPVTRRHLPSLWWTALATVVAYAPTSALMLWDDVRYGSAVPTYKALADLARSLAHTGMRAWAWAFLVPLVLLAYGLLRDARVARVAMAMASGLSGCWAIALWGYLSTDPPAFGAGSAAAWSALALLQGKAASARRMP